MKLPVLVAALIASVALAAPAAAAAKKHQKAARPGVSKLQVPSRAASDPSAVYVSGEYIGRDPDPNIRAYMIRNPHQWDGPQ